MIENPKILIVDDNQLTVQLFKTIFELGGFQAFEAFDGRQALECVSQQKVDLILLDIMMPDIDGLTVCRSLKQDPEHAHIPVIITSLLDPYSQQKGSEAGANLFLTKPINVPDLLSAVKAMIEAVQPVPLPVGG